MGAGGVAIVRNSDHVAVVPGAQIEIVLHVEDGSRGCRGAALSAAVPLECGACGGVVPAGLETRVVNESGVDIATVGESSKRSLWCVVRGGGVRRGAVACGEGKTGCARCVGDEATRDRVGDAGV